MSQTFAENENKNECCICYNDNSEGNEEGKLIECCPNKHILCVECFHKSYERKCECPLCRELMYKPEIMTDVESLAYFGAKVALNDRREREEQQRQIRLAEAERLQQAEERRRAEELAFFERRRVEAERQRQVQLEHLPVRKTERIQSIQRDIAIKHAEIENINNLDLDAYNAIYPPNFELRASSLQPTIISDSDSDSDSDRVEVIYNPQPTRPIQIQPVARPVQIQLLARPVQIQPVARPVVQQPVATRPVEIMLQQRMQLMGRVVTPGGIEIINQSPRQVQQQPVSRPVQQRRSSTYAREKLRQDDILVQVLNSHRMFLRYDRLNDTFIRADNNRVYRTLNSASVDHAEEVGLSYHPNPWTTFKRSDGSRIDNL